MFKHFWKHTMFNRFLLTSIELQALKQSSKLPKHQKVKFLAMIVSEKKILNLDAFSI